MTASFILAIWKNSLVFFSLLPYALPVQLQLKPARSSIQAQGSVLPHKYNAIYDVSMFRSKPKIKHPFLYRTMCDKSSANHSITSSPTKEKKILYKQVYLQVQPIYMYRHTIQAATPHHIVTRSVISTKVKQENSPQLFNDAYCSVHHSGVADSLECSQFSSECVL